MQVELLIAHFSSGSALIPLMLAAFNWKRLSAELKGLFLIVLISFSADAASLILMEYSINTLFIGNLYLVFQFSILIWIFRRQFQNKRISDAVLFLFVLFYGVNITFFQGPNVFNSVSNVMACLILIAFCVYYLYKLLSDLPTTHIQNLPMLWISFAVMTYYAGNFFLFLVGNYLLVGGNESHRMLWILHNLLNIIKNILFAIALWQSYNKARSSTLSSSAH